MTHEELLAMIEEKIDNVESISGIKATPWHSLRAVVELHKPCNCDEAHCDYCTDLGDLFSNQSYPCPTIQAIEKELK